MEEEDFLKRGLIFGLLLAIFNFTLLRHYGHGLEDIYGLTGVAAVVGGLLTVFEKISKKSADETVKRKWVKNVRGFLNYLLWKPVLVALGIGVLVFASMTSSVIVSGDTAENGSEGVSLLRLERTPSIPSPQAKNEGDLEADIRTAKCAERAGTGDAKTYESLSDDRAKVREELRAKDEPYRFVVSTTPFGRSYQLKVKGYLSRIIDVYPIWGIRLSPGRDLQRAPSVLFRPDVDSMSDLQNGGYVVFSTVQNGKPTLLGCMPGKRTSFLLGSMDTLPGAEAAKLLDSWRLELKAAEENDKTISKTLVEWKDATKLELPSGVDLTPRMQVKAEIRSVKGTIVASREITLGDAPLADVRISYAPK